MNDFCVICTMPCGKVTVSKPLDFVTASRYSRSLAHQYVFHNGVAKQFEFKLVSENRATRQLRAELTALYSKVVVETLDHVEKQLETKKPDDCDEDLLRGQH